MAQEREVGMKQEPGAWPLEHSREVMNGETEGSVFMRCFSIKPKQDGSGAQIVQSISELEKDDFSLL